MKRPAVFFSAVAFSIAAAALPLAAQTPAPSPAATGSPAAPPLDKPIPPDSPKYGVYPIGYREIITRWVKERLVDPESAQLEFGEPVAGEVKQKTARASGYRVDFKVNSRNKFGTYTGWQRYQVLIRNGEIVWADRVRG
jgi:hypothetical protein